VLGHGLWQRRFGARDDVVGQTVRTNRGTFTIVGVMPPGFAFPAHAELWTSLAIDEEYAARGARHMSGLGRLKHNVSLESATAELLGVEQLLATRHPENYADRGVHLRPLEAQIVGDVRPALVVLSGAVVLILLMSCVNVASLLLTRAIARRREIAIRLAVGASRSKLARQMLCEALGLFGTAAILGLGLATAVVQAVRTLSPDVLPRADTVDVNWSVALFAILVATVSGVVVGLIPAVQAASAPALSLGDERRGSTGGRSAGRLRASLIVAETALAATLLVGAGLLVRSLQELTRVDPGLPVVNVLTFELSAPPRVGKAPESVVAFFRDVRAGVSAIPGVRGVALASRLPLSGADHTNGFRLEGEIADPRQERSAQDRAVSSGFFRAIGIPILRGREFTDADTATSPPVIIVNEVFARQYFPAGDAVGQRMIPSRAGRRSREIVGIAGDTRQVGLETPAVPEFYIPHAQDPWPFLGIAVRTAGDPAMILPQVRALIASFDADLPLRRVRTMEQLTSDAGLRRRAIALLLSAFAGMAYLLAAIGLYGVVALAVAARTAEIGIRMALGAPRRAVVGLVVGRSVTLATMGALCGLIASLALTRWLGDLLFGVGASDPATLACVGLMIPAIALLAAIVPTRRALAVDPVRAIRASS
jgi:putative ABC transport system permease protein